VDAVHSLVHLGYDIHAGTEDGESLLSIAASSGFYDICEVKSLLSYSELYRFES